MRKRIVLTTWGSYGDLFPYLGLAIRLKALGHAPVLATCAYYRNMVEAEGIEFRPIRPDVDPSDQATIAKVIDPEHGTEVLLRELLVPYVREAFDDLLDAVRGADLLVTHPVTFAGPLVGEARRLTWLSTVLAPTSFFSRHDFPILRPGPGVFRLARKAQWAARAVLGLAKRITAPWTAPVRAFRDERGLADRGDPLYEGQFSPHGTLALFSPIFGPPQPDWPPHTTATGFVFHRNEHELPADVRAFLDAGDPPVVFTLGTSAVGAAGDFYRESRLAMETLGRRAIFLVGRDPRNQAGPPLPPTMLAAEYAPHGLLFPRAAAIVHHGGVGTTAEAMRSGRPMIVVPHAHDQPDNAFRASRLGVARVLDAGAYRAAPVVRHMRALLAEDAGYQARAADLGRHLSSERGVDVACETMLQYVQ